MKMNPEIRDAWIARLESGVDNQGTNALEYSVSIDGEPSETKRCCLGVLCDMAADEGVVTSSESAEGESYKYRFFDGDSATLPRSVMNWAGIDTNLGKITDDEGNPVIVEVNGKKSFSLSGHNDSGATFADIAQVIREHF